MQVQTLTSNAFLVTGESVNALVEIKNGFQPEYRISGKGAKKFAADIKKAVMNHIRQEEILRSGEAAYKVLVTSCFFGRYDEEIRILTKDELLELANTPGFGVEVIEEITGERRELAWK